MHIPDGYLSPQITIPALAVMAPFWSLALKKIKEVLKNKQIPFLALCSAFSFIIMMFNVPVGNSSVHATGAVFIAILLGPWAACIAVSIALIIQAFVFGDGGILAIGANCFNMALIMPFAGYYTFKLIKGSSGINTKRGIFGIFAGSYIGINLAALLTAIEFGIQPIFFKALDGTPLYGYYPLSVSVPTMMFEHVLFAGPIEGIITVSAISYLVKFAPHLLNNINDNKLQVKQSFVGKYKSFLLGLLLLILLSPLGLIATGTAWGEWSSEELKELIGFVPSGFSKFSNYWTSIMPDYTLPFVNETFYNSSLGYIVSGIVGISIISIVTFIISKIVLKEQNNHNGTI